MGGLREGLAQLRQAASQIAEAGQGGQLPAGDMLHGLVLARAASNAVAANAAVIRRWDEMLGNLLDVNA